MNTIENNTHIVLKDGKARIATWIPASPGKLTVGDRVELPQDVLLAHPVYGGHAVVSRVEVDSNHGRCEIEVEAECPVPANRRPYVALNSSLVPAIHRDSIEKIVRDRISLPVIEWEASYGTMPVLRFHPSQSRVEITLAGLNHEIGRHLRALPDHSGLLTTCAV